MNRNFNLKKNLLIDLDATVISSIPSEEFPFEDKAIEKKAKKLAIHNILDYYITFERPYLNEFLDYIFKNFNVSVWTAASKDYALFIVNNIIIGKSKNRQIDYIFYSYHCNISYEIYGDKQPKKLELLWKYFNLPGYREDNTFIIDDLKDVYRSQPNRTIRAPAFDFLKDNSINDDFLLKMIAGQYNLEKMIDEKVNNNN